MDNLCRVLNFRLNCVMFSSNVVFEVIFQKRVRVFYGDFQTRESLRLLGRGLLLFSSVWKPQ